MTMPARAVHSLAAHCHDFQWCVSLSSCRSRRNINIHFAQSTHIHTSTTDGRRQMYLSSTRRYVDLLVSCLSSDVDYIDPSTSPTEPVIFTS